MAKRNVSETKTVRLALQGALTIYQAEELKGQILASVDQTAELEIDLCEVAEIDSAGVQLLMAAKQTAKKQGGKLRLVGHSRPVVEVFELLNLSAFFGDPILLAGTDAPRGGV